MAKFVYVATAENSSEVVYRPVLAGMEEEANLMPK